MSNEVIPPSAPSDFIRDIVAADLQSGASGGRVVTRFPPEPNGYLHIGHAKSICLNFGIAREHNGQCNLRMDDTNPTKEDVEYVESIIEDVQWLLAGWAEPILGLKAKGQLPVAQTVNGKPDHYLPAKVGEGAGLALRAVEPFYASDYFDQIYEFAVRLIELGHAFVCDLTPAEMEEYRGSPDRPGKDSPFRTRSV